MDGISRRELVKQEFDALFPDSGKSVDGMNSAEKEKYLQKVCEGLARVDELQREEDADYLWELRSDLLVNQATLVLEMGRQKESDKLLRTALKLADEGARKWNSADLAETAVSILEHQADMSFDQEFVSKALDLYLKALKRLEKILEKTPSADTLTHRVFLLLEIADVWMAKDANTQVLDYTMRAVQAAEEMLRDVGEEKAEFALTAAYMRWGATLDFVGWNGEGQEPADRLVSFATDRVAHTDGDRKSRSILSQALFLRGDYTMAKGQGLQALDDYRRGFQIMWDLVKETGDETLQEFLAGRCQALTQMAQITGAERLKYARIGLKCIQELAQKQTDFDMGEMGMYFQALL